MKLRSREPSALSPGSPPPSRPCGFAIPIIQADRPGGGPFHPAFGLELLCYGQPRQRRRVEGCRTDLVPPSVFEAELSPQSDPRVQVRPPTLRPRPGEPAGERKPPAPPPSLRGG